MNVPFKRLWLTGKEEQNISEALLSGHLSGNGKFTERCNSFFRDHYKIPYPFLTHSCTGALEMSALLLNVKEGDEIIFPSYTFVSTVNAFLLRGAKAVFADSCVDHPNIDPDSVRKKITSSTKGIVLVHYAGMACDMDAFRKIGNEKNIWLVEDAAQGVDAYYNNELLGTIGILGAYSFHDTKNVIAGEAGLLIVKEKEMAARAEIIGEKGTDRSAFLRKEVKDYRWKELGSTYYPSETTAAILYSQLQELNTISSLRKNAWNRYHQLLDSLKDNHMIELPAIKNYMRHNAQHYFFTCKNGEIRDSLLNYLKSKGISAASHFKPLHLSDFYLSNHERFSLPHSEKFGEGLIRLPLFTGISIEEIEYVAENVLGFFNDRKN
jgi:dTDP-4-amino-4,6-dideoxygalactose transaminase